MPRNPDLPCADCGKLLWRSTTSLPEGQAVCQPCRRLRPRRGVKTLILQCQGCGVEFNARKPTQKFCSRGCAGVENGSATRPCEVCGVLYRYSYPKQRTCGRACGVLLRQCVTGSMNVAQISLASPRPPGQDRSPKSGLPGVTACKVCGAGIHYTIRTGPKPPRCAKCQAKIVRVRVRDAKRGRTHKQRALHHGVEYQPIRVSRIYQRDEWVCQLCGEPVDPELKYPDSMSASLDHVLPMALGGGHCPDNVQLAHWLCNVLKGATHTDFLLDSA